MAAPSTISFSLLHPLSPKSLSSFSPKFWFLISSMWTTQEAAPGEAPTGYWRCSCQRRRSPHGAADLGPGERTCARTDASALAGEATSSSSLMAGVTRWSSSDLGFDHHNENLIQIWQYLDSMDGGAFRQKGELRHWPLRGGIATRFQIQGTAGTKWRALLCGLPYKVRGCERETKLVFAHFLLICHKIL